MNDSLLLVASRIYDSLQSGYPDPASLSQLKDDLEVIIDTYSKGTPHISNTTSDFYTLLFQLREYVKREDTWKDFYISSTGTTLLELIAAVGSFLQNSISVSFREAFPHTAIRSSSLYASTRLLGVKIDRKTSSKVKVWLRRLDTTERLIVPSFTQFLIKGSDYFNSEDIIFPIGESIIPLNVAFDELGTASRKDKISNQIFLAQVIFPNEGQIYYPCTGKIEVTTIENKVFTGTIDIVVDPNFKDSAFGSIHFKDTAIVPISSTFKITLSQYSGSTVEGELAFYNSSMYLRFPTTIPFQIKRTGTGASITTPITGTANIPQASIILTNEDYLTVKSKYLLPQYLNKPVIVYDNDLILYSGRVSRQEHIVSETKDFYTFSLNEPGFSVSNDHLKVEVFDGSSQVKWNKAESNSLINHGPEDLVYIESTTSSGDCILTFGNSIHGKGLNAGWLIRVFYVLTNGLEGNIGEIGETISCPSFNLVGETITSPYGGSNEKNPIYYKNIAPSLFKARGRAVTLSDHEAIFLSYPNVADVAILGQKDVAPYDVRFMNRITVVLLPNSPLIKTYPKDSLKAGKIFDSTITDPKDPNEPNIYKFTELELLDFQNRFKEFAFASLDVDLFNYPIPKPITVKVRVFIYHQFSIDNVASLISNSIRNLFIRSLGILGRSLMIADITAACHSPEVDYVEVIYPVENIILTDSVQDKKTFICLESAPEILVEYTNRRV